MMWKRATDILAAMLLLSAILLTIAAARSATHADALVLDCSHGVCALASSRGVFHVVTCHVPVVDLHGSSVHLELCSTEEAMAYRDEMVIAADWQIGYSVNRAAAISLAGTPTVERLCWGFSIDMGTNALTVPGKWYVFASAPDRALIPLLLIVPLRVISSRVKRWRRARRGQCLACGYDRRESPGRCPECGLQAGGHGD